MSYRTASFLVLSFLAALGAVYIWFATGLTDSRNRASIGPAYFPIGLGILLLVLCALSAVQTVRRTDRPDLTLPNAGFVGLAIVATGTFLVAWRYLDSFYALTFVFAAGLMVAFAPKRDPKRVALYLGLAAVLTAVIYGLFGVIMQVRF